MISRLGSRTLDILPAEPFLRSSCPASGISLTGVQELLDAGRPSQPLRGVLVRADLPDTLERRAAAARPVLPDGAALCRTTSAWLFGIDARGLDAQRAVPAVECAVPVGRTPIQRADLVHLAGPNRSRPCPLVEPREWLRLRFHDPGFPTPELQISITDRSGREVYRLDLGYPRLRFSGEYDGEEHHRGLAAEAADRRRRADLERRSGWTVIGVGKNLVLGPSMDLEMAVGEVIGIRPAISRRAW
jgi:hypothetical protein